VGDQDLFLPCCSAVPLQGKVQVVVGYCVDLLPEQELVNGLWGLKLENRTDEWENQQQTEFRCPERHLTQNNPTSYTIQVLAYTSPHHQNENPPH
jgi:hypothetical protein